MTSASMNDEDIQQLKMIVSGGVERPAFYKGGFSLDYRARAALKILRKHGVDGRQDDDTGRVTFTSAEGCS